MKSIRILIFFLLPFNCFAQKVINSKSTFLTLTAVRNNYTYSYPLSSSIRVVYIKDGIKKVAKGKLFKVSPEGLLYISSFRRDTALTVIAAESVYSIKKIHRTTKIVTGAIMGASIVGGLVLGNKFDNNNLGTTLIVLAVITGVFSFTLSLALTYLKF